MITTILYDFLLIFVPLFVVIDPAGTVPVYLALTRNQPEPRRREIARRATVIAAVVGVLFVAAGQALFAMLGVKFADFQIAGGVLLFVLSLIDLLTTGKPAVDEQDIKSAADHPQDMVSAVPLAVPLIVGPATMTTSLLLVSSFSPKYSGEDFFGPGRGAVAVVLMVCTALVLNLMILFACMKYAGAIERVFGTKALSVVNKIVMILLAAIAVSLIRQGITSIVLDLRK